MHSYTSEIKTMCRIINCCRRDIMKENEIINISALSSDMEIIIKAMKDGKDSECAIIGASYIDKCLCNVLYNKIPIEDKAFILKSLFLNEQNPLGTYSSRNKILYALKLIDDKTFNDIKNIGYIRNKFAHNYLVTVFSNSEVTGYCNKLTLWENHFHKHSVNEINSTKPNLTNDVLKQIFIYSSINIMQKLVADGLIIKLLGEDYY